MALHTKNCSGGVFEFNKSEILQFQLTTGEEIIFHKYTHIIWSLITLSSDFFNLVMLRLTEIGETTIPMRKQSST